MLGSDFRRACAEQSLLVSIQYSIVDAEKIHIPKHWWGKSFPEFLHILDGPIRANRLRVPELNPFFANCAVGD